MLLVEHGTPAWHDMRKQGIGASEVSALFGFARFGKTAVKVWESKQQGYQPAPYEEHQLMGLWLEPALLNLFEHRTGMKCFPNKNSLQHPNAPWLFATPDGIVDDGAPIDCKTSIHYAEWGEDGTDQIPTDYLIQVQTQIMCAGASHGWLVVFFSLYDKRIYRIDAHPQMQAEIMKVTGKMWSEWKAGKPPAPINPEDCRILWPMLTEKVVNIDTTSEDTTQQTLIDAIYQIDALDDEIRALKSQRDTMSTEIKAIVTKSDALKAAIAQYMGDARILSIDGLHAFRRTLRKGSDTPTLHRVRNKDAYTTAA